VIVIAGTVRIPPANLDRFRPRMLEMVAASRAEDGCVEYCYAQDVGDPGLVRVFEIWRDETALARHFHTEHMTAWRAAWPDFGVSDRDLSLYDVSAVRPL
jgi:quinol monooxygenase YgiN